VLQSEIGKTIEKNFGVLPHELRLDDAFCVHYNPSQHDSGGAKHMDPSDITVNMCIEKTPDVVGSHVLFYGSQPLQNSAIEERKEVGDFRYHVSQEEGFATIHWGHHPHETTPLINGGRRTNLVLTYCYKDPARSNVAIRTCYT
jgi:hypothetical protein